MPEDIDPNAGAAAVTDPGAQAPDTAALLAASERRVAILTAGLSLESDAGRMALENPGVDLATLVKLTTPVAPADPAVPNAAQAAALQAAQLATGQADQDAAAAAATAARTGLAAGGVSDAGPADVHPMDLAKQAIADGLNKQYLGHTEAVALGVGQIMNAAIRGDSRVNYIGRVAPGA